MKKRSPPRTAPLSSAAFARHLLSAMGLGASAAALLGGAACGGNVVVDTGGDGSGGSTSTSTSTSTTTDTTTITTTTTGTVPCDQQATVYEMLTECISPTDPGSGCPSKDLAYGPIYMQMANEGCGGAEIASILCGPTAMPGGQCCYVVDGSILLCGGRPFVVGGSARIAEAEARSDWLSRIVERPRGLDQHYSESALRTSCDAATRAALAEAWTRSALDEHASVASFARFVLDLLAVGAPADLVVAAQAAMGDEIRHAELCFGLASAHAGRALGPGALAIDGARTGADLAEIAAAAVREGCVGETIAAFVAAASRDAATDADARSALTTIAADEADHAALAFRFVAWAVREGDARVRAAVRDAFAAALAAPAATPPALAGDPAALRRHGHLPPVEQRALAARCVAEVIRPCAAALLAVPADGVDLQGSMSV